MATKITTPSPRTMFHGMRRFYSDVPGKVPENSTQRHHVISGDGYNMLVSSSSPMPDKIQIILEKETASISGNFNEPATKADSINPNTSSQHPREPFPDQSSSKEDDYSEVGDVVGGVLAAGLIVLVIFLFWDPFAKEDDSRKEEEKLKNNSTSPDTSSQHPTEPVPDQSSSKKDDYSDAAGVLAYLLIWLLIFSSWALCAQGEELRKEEEKLKMTLQRKSDPCGECVLRTQRKKLAEKLEALDKEEWEHYRQREIVFEVKMETQEALVETDRALESAREAANARILADGTHTVTGDAKSETGNHSPIVLVMVLGSSLGLGVSIGMCVFGS